MRKTSKGMFLALERKRGGVEFDYSIIDMYENKKIFVLGMARSGYEVAKLLHKNNEILITDSKPQEVKKIEELESLGIKFIETLEPESLLDDSFHCLIKNPAVFPYHPCVEKAHNLNIPVVNEMEVAYHYLKKSAFIIGVTGSNGKTSTVNLIYEVLKKAGRKVKVGGNIGTPLAAIVNTIEDNDILLLEISDHQLNDFKDFKTDISILLNVCPTHLDYHGSYEAYKNIKKKIFLNHEKKDLAIINEKNYDSLELTHDILSTKFYFNNEINCLKDDIIYIANEPIINTHDILLKGKHNYENIIAMLLLMKILDVDFKYAIDVLKEFKGVAHRLEFVREYRGVKYYNDSKSTNPTATLTALKSFDAPIHLILGGMDRSQNFAEIISELNKVVRIYAIGEVRERIRDFANANNVSCQEFGTLRDALNEIKENVNDGDIVLLSPASASWDQYAKFEDRGEEFKNIVIKY